MEEPSVLDYLKAKLTPWRGQKIEIPPAERPLGSLPPSVAESGEPLEQTAKPSGASSEVGLSSIEVSLDEFSVAGEMPAPAVAVPIPAIKAVIPWRTLSAILLALVAQLLLEPGPQRVWQPGAMLYGLAGICLIWAYLRSEWSEPQEQSPDQATAVPAFRFRWVLFVIAFASAVISFQAFADNHFSRFNVTLLAIALVALLAAFWQPGEGGSFNWRRLFSWFGQQEWKLTFNRWTLLVFFSIALVVFFRFYRLQQVPPEMVSDHAEKLLDVWDVLNGQTSIFFPRNTGREALQMYMTAAIVRWLGTGISFLSLKIGSVLAGLLTLPFIYLLGKDNGNRRIGLYAVLFAGMAYWPNVISRVGLRFPLYPLFVAPTLYFLVRGLRTSRINDFLLAGLALGVGLHGYTPIRILPFVILAAVGIYLLHRHQLAAILQALVGLVLLGLVSFFVFLPLLRYALENPLMFSFRSFSRLGTMEQPLPGPAWEIFLSNLGRGLAMYVWDDGEIWVHSIMHRPALDVVTAALFTLGVIYLIARYVRKRDWRDLFWLVSIPMLMMPSILSLAFPSENPALNRASGALVPVFLIVGIALDGVLETIRRRIGGQTGQALATVAGVCLFLAAATQNYNLVFGEYYDYFRRASWNTSEMGQVIGKFAASVGSPDTAWVLAYPHWVDTRLVGMNAGFPTRDYAISKESLPDTLADPRPKLFLVKTEDTAGLDALRAAYPDGVLQIYQSADEGHNFWMYFVLPP